MAGWQMSLAHSIDGYAIISDNHCIADANGDMPDCLKNDADWAYFQAALDAATITVVGRKGHQANPNHKARRRLILSRSVSSLVQRSDGWWWNPAGHDWVDVVQQVAPEGGSIAVPGGRDVFDLFLNPGYASFHLARAEGSYVPNGTKLFSGLGDSTPEQLLADHGMQPGPTTWLDQEARVSLTVWRKSGANVSVSP
jgi:dihydrofolate reductase